MRTFCLVAVAVASFGCGDNDSGLENYFPFLPPPTGGAQAVFAGQVTSPSQLVTGPAQSGMVGDYFIKNDRVTFIVQAPTRVIGVIPQGGNVVDAVLTKDGAQIVDDHFGELGLVYLLGRTCEPDRLEIVRDGAGGGIAALRSIGKSGNDDFLNLKGIGALRVDPTVDPDIDDGVDCATTYVLSPDSTTLEVYHSLYNGSSDSIAGPMGTIADTGGTTEAWTNTRGFERADIGAIATLATPAPSDYVIYQGPNVAYGIVPRHDKPAPHAQTLIAGVSVILDGNDALLDILNPDKYYLHLASKDGFLQRYDLVVGHDASDIDIVWRNGKNLMPISGRVDFSAGGTATGARVGVFLDGNGNGVLDDYTVDTLVDGQADDYALLYMDVAADGTYHGQIPMTAGGNLLVRAEVKNVGRSAAAPVAATVNLTIPSPIKVDFQILDHANGLPIPGRLVVIGDHPAFPDQRVFETYDRATGVVTQEHAIRGTTVDLGDGVDEPLYLPAGGHYMIYASRGTEWSVAAQAVSTDGNYVFELDHVVPGIECTPFAYGHFNAWPLTPDSTSPNGGAVDWARGAALGQAMIPGEVYAALQARGAQMVQVNHPRGSGFTEFQAAFTRANVKYDYANHTIFGDYANADVPNDWLRLPEENLWSDNFTGLEIWNGFNILDTNSDGLRENKSLDSVMRDWLSMLSLGFYVTPAGDSDTHTVMTDPLGMPRTYVYVGDDSADALAAGTAVDQVVATQTGYVGKPRDVVITDGPMIDVKIGGNPALGRTFASVGAPITVDITVYSAEWATFDTLEVFANSTPASITQSNDTTLVPLQCWTSRTIAALDPKDPCSRASLTAQPMTVSLLALPSGAKRYQATVQVTLDAADITTLAGAHGSDAWLVFRVRGNVGIFPIMLNAGAVTDATMPALMSGDLAQIRAALDGKGVPAEAVTAPIFVDFDGGGYRAPFAP